MTCATTQWHRHCRKRPLIWPDRRALLVFAALGDTVRGRRGRDRTIPAPIPPGGPQRARGTGSRRSRGRLPSSPLRRRAWQRGPGHPSRHPSRRPSPGARRSRQAQPEPPQPGQPPGVTVSRVEMQLRPTPPQVRLLATVSRVEVPPIPTRQARRHSFRSRNAATTRDADGQIPAMP